MIRTLLAVLLIAPLGTAAAAEETTDRAPSLSDVKQTDTVDEARQTLTTVLQALDTLSEKRFEDCVRVVGNDAYCQCVNTRLPIAINAFAQYVAIVTSSRDDIKYDDLESGKQEIVDRVHAVREECVSGQN